MTNPKARRPTSPRKKPSPKVAREVPRELLPRPSLRRLSDDAYLGAWNAFVGDFSTHVRNALLQTAATEPSVVAPTGDGAPRSSGRRFPNLWIDRDGTQWDLTRDRVPLDMPYVAPRDVGFWRLHEPDRGDDRPSYHTVDPIRMRHHEAHGVHFAPSALRIESTFEIMAAGDYLSAYIDEQDYPLWPGYRVVGGVFSKHFLEGGWEARSVPIPVNLPDARDRVIDAHAVRLAIGMDLGGLALEDGWLSLVDVTVDGDRDRGFTITLDASAMVPAMDFKNRMKKLTLRWSPSDGDPYEFLCTYLSEHAFGPGSEEWWY
jgi:hypothetical protein